MKWRIRSQILRKKQKTFLRRNMQVTACTFGKTSNTLLGGKKKNSAYNSLIYMISLGFLEHL